MYSCKSRDTCTNKSQVQQSIPSNTNLEAIIYPTVNLQNFQEWYQKPFQIKLSVSLPTPAFQTQELKFGLAPLLIVVAPVASILTLAINFKPS
jgi:hypothetical protein